MRKKEVDFARKKKKENLYLEFIMQIKIKRRKIILINIFE